jgi:LEA14-like dessication related protein
MRSISTGQRRWPAPKTAFLITTCLLLILTGCASLTQPWIAPEVAVTSLKPQQLGLDQQTFLVGLRIHNPNDRMLPIKAMSYRLSLEGDQVAAGGGKLERQIPAFGEESAEVSVTGNAAQVMARLPMLMLQSRPLNYQIAGTVTVAGVIPIPYRYSGELDPKVLLRSAPMR